MPTYRDSLKIACLNYALEQGLDEEGMITLFEKAAELVKMKKTASLGSAAAGAMLLATTPATIPLALWASSHLGKMTGQAAKDIQESGIIDVEGVQKDELADQYNQIRKAVEERIALNEEKKKLLSAPSKRKLF